MKQEDTTTIHFLKTAFRSLDLWKNVESADCTLSYNQGIHTAQIFINDNLTNIEKKLEEKGQDLIWARSVHIPSHSHAESIRKVYMRFLGPDGYETHYPISIQEEYEFNSVVEGFQNTIHEFNCIAPNQEQEDRRLMQIHTKEQLELKREELEWAKINSENAISSQKVSEKSLSSTNRTLRFSIIASVATSILLVIGLFIQHQILQTMILSKDIQLIVEGLKLF